VDGYGGLGHRLPPFSRTLQSEVEFRFRTIAESRFRFHPDMALVKIKPPESVERVLRADARRNHKRVLDAARRCMARKGLDAQIEEIARAAGVGVGTVYRHFPTKEHLVEALAMARFERLGGLAREARATEDPWAGFEGFMRAGAAF